MIRKLHVDRRIYEIKKDFGLYFSFDNESEEEVERPATSPKPQREPPQPVSKALEGPLIERNSRHGSLMEAPIEIDPSQIEEPSPTQASS